MPGWSSYWKVTEQKRWGRDGEGEPLSLGSAGNKLKIEIMEAHVPRSGQEIREVGRLSKVGEQKSIIDNHNAPFSHLDNYRNFFECYSGKKKKERNF